MKRKRGLYDEASRHVHPECPSKQTLHIINPEETKPRKAKLSLGQDETQVPLIHLMRATITISSPRVLNYVHQIFLKRRCLFMSKLIFHTVRVNSFCFA